MAMQPLRVFVCAAIRRAFIMAALAALAAPELAHPARAQIPLEPPVMSGANSITATTTSQSVTLAQGGNTNNPYRGVLITLGAGAAVDVYYLPGPANVAVTTATGAHIPPNGICIHINNGTNVAVITGSSTAVVHFQQLSYCPGYW